MQKTDYQIRESFSWQEDEKYMEAAGFARHRSYQKHLRKTMPDSVRLLIERKTAGSYLFKTAGQNFE